MVKIVTNAEQFMDNQ